MGKNGNAIKMCNLKMWSCLYVCSVAIEQEQHTLFRYVFVVLHRSIGDYEYIRLLIWRCTCNNDANAKFRLKHFFSEHFISLHSNIPLFRAVCNFVFFFINMKYKLERMQSK